MPTFIVGDLSFMNVVTEMPSMLFLNEKGFVKLRSHDGRSRIALREPQGPCGMTVEKERSHNGRSPTINVGMTVEKERTPLNVIALPSKNVIPHPS